MPIFTLRIITEGQKVKTAAARNTLVASLTKRHFIFLVYGLLTIGFFSCDYFNGDIDDYVGTFKINKYRSDFGHLKDTTSYEQLTLIIRRNRTFEFSHDFPFIKEQKGEWYTTSGDVGDTYCNFRYGEYSDDQYECHPGGGISTNYPIGKKDSLKADYLYFDKISDDY
jgi:hypothetical protein